jgi:hypothetical protein
VLFHRIHLPNLVSDYCLLNVQFLLTAPSSKRHSTHENLHFGETFHNLENSVQGLSLDIYKEDTHEKMPATRET